jgi:hypothetical protein
VTQGDLTRAITVQAQGRGRGAQGHHQRDDPQPADTTQKNTEQDWLKTNLAKFSRMLQGQKDINTVGA